MGADWYATLDPDKSVERPFAAYKGNEPYIFVSYAHEDATAVFPEITRLRDQGFRIWYDEGIEPGSVWRQELAEALAGCSVLLFFISPASVASPHCLKELNFGLGRNRELLCVHLEKTDLPAAVEFSISDKQAIIRSEYSEAQYRDKLDNSLRLCIGIEPPAAVAEPAQPQGRNENQHVQYCRTPDGFSLAWSRIGQGQPIVRSLGWFTNLEMEWQNATGRRFWQAFARHNEIIRYDARGIGLSERDVEELSLETRLVDLETVVDASGHQRVALIGMSEGGLTAIAYAATHPERVSHLVLWGTFLKAAPRDDSNVWQGLMRLIPSGWGSDSDAFRQMFTGLFLPDGTAEHNRFFNDMQKASATAEVALKTLVSIGQTDVTELARRIKAPTLIMHRKGDLVVDQKNAHELARTIPGARLVLLEGANHWMWIQEADTAQLIRTVTEFVRQ